MFYLKSNLKSEKIEENLSNLRVEEKKREIEGNVENV